MGVLFWVPHSWHDELLCHEDIWVRLQITYLKRKDFPIPTSKEIENKSHQLVLKTTMERGVQLLKTDVWFLTLIVYEIIITVLIY